MRRLLWLCVASCLLLLCGTPDARGASQGGLEAIKIHFDDVPESSKFYAAIMWGVGKGITNGTSATTFSPSDSCARKQVITFLWRAQGSPEPEIENPYDDVTPENYFYKAAIWAFQEGIIVEEEVSHKIETGEDVYSFNGSAVCTRADMVMYLYRFERSPAMEATEDVDNFSFADITENPALDSAVRWAVEKGITDGRGKNEKGEPLFSPEESCTRGQCITFLYRYMVEGLS